MSLSNRRQAITLFYAVRLRSFFLCTLSTIGRLLVLRCFLFVVRKEFSVARTGIISVTTTEYIGITL